MKYLDYDIAIIGAGCIGSSIAFELTRRGFRNVVALDSGRTTLSATASSGGMLRVFHENSLHTELALKNYNLLAKYQNQNILSQKSQSIGSLYFFDQRRYRDYENSLQLMESHSYPFEVLTPQFGRLRFPQFHWSNNQWAIFEPLASQLSPQKFTDDLLTFSQTAGLTMQENFEVDRICYFRDRYRIYNKESVMTAKTIILSGGARILPLLKELGIGHSLKPQPLTVYKSQKLFPDLKIPNFFDRETLEYSAFGTGTDFLISNPNTQRFIKPYWKDSFTTMTALDCYSPNRQGFAGYLMGQPRMILATGWGGTAFKFALEIGSRVGHVLETELSERGLSHA